jgi:hypothetical protein
VSLFSAFSLVSEATILLHANLIQAAATKQVSGYLGHLSIRLLWSQHTVCMCVFPCRSCCDHNAVCLVYLSMRLLWSELHIVCSDVWWKETLISTPYKKKKKLSLESSS